MKEESKKVSFLVNRYGLLAALGLGVSFLGTKASGTTAPIPDPVYTDVDENGRLLVGKSPDGFFEVDSANNNIKLTPQSKDANVFAANRGGLMLTSKSTSPTDNDVMVQFLFDKSQESGGFKPETAHHYSHYKTAFETNGEVNNYFNSAKHDSLGKILDKLEAEIVKEIISGLPAADVRANAIAGGAKVDGLNKGVNDVHVGRVLGDFKAKNFASASEMDTWLSSFVNAVGANVEGKDYSNESVASAGDQITEDQLKAIGTELKRLMDDSINATRNAFWNDANRKNDIIYTVHTLATEVRDLAKHLDDGMKATTAGSMWNNAAETGKLKTLLSSNATGGTIGNGTLSAKGIIDKLKAEVEKVKAFLSDRRGKKDITDGVLNGAKSSLSTIGSGTGEAVCDAFVGRCTEIANKLDTMEAEIKDNIRGLITISPNAPLTPNKNRTFVAQITANELQHPLNLKNEFNGIMVAVNAKKMVANDRVIILFDTFDAAKQLQASIEGGSDIFLDNFDNLNGQLNLVLVNKHNGKTIPLGGLVNLASLSASLTTTPPPSSGSSSTPPTTGGSPLQDIFDHVNLALVQSDKTPVDQTGNPTAYTYVFDKEINVNSLEVGKDDGKLAFSHMQKDSMMKESPVAVGASADFKKGLKAKTTITLNKESFIKSTEISANNLLDKGSRIVADKIDINDGTISGDSVWKTQQLVAGGNLQIKECKFELSANTLALKNNNAMCWNIEDATVSIKENMQINPKVDGSNTYIPVFKMKSKADTNSTIETDEDKTIIEIAEDKKISLPEIKTDKVNGDVLATFISIEKDSILQIRGGENKAAGIESMSNNHITLIRIGENGTAKFLGKLNIGFKSQGEGNGKGVAIHFDKNSTAIFKGQLTLNGNMKVDGTKVIFSPQSMEEPCLNWANGQILDGKTIGEVLVSFNAMVKKLGGDGAKAKLANGTALNIISLKGNSKAAEIVNALRNIKAPKDGYFIIDEGKLQEALEKAAEGGGGTMVLPPEVITANPNYDSNKKEGDGPNPVLDPDGEPPDEPPERTGSQSSTGDNEPISIWARTSPDLRRILNEEMNQSEENRSVIGGALAGIILNEDLDPKDKERALGLISKGTSEEKARLTLQIIESVRDVLYSKLDGDPGTPYRSLWASAFGDVARNDIDGYKMNCDIHGFVAGGDVRVNDVWTIGVLGGYGKAKGKYKGDWFMPDSSNKCDHKSYFGGVYTMWDDLITDLNLKVSLLGGHCKYNESRGYMDFDDFRQIFQNEDFHKGFFVSGDIDATYKHWSACGLDFGPWVALSVTKVHHREFNSVIGSYLVRDEEQDEEENEAQQGEEEYSSVSKSISAANRRAVNTTLGIAASYDLTTWGALALNLGYKHDFRRLKGGDAELKIEGDDDTIKYGLLNGKSGRDSFVTKASMNMQFGQFGLSLGGHGQIGNHFKDIAGSITASYSF